MSYIRENGVKDMNSKPSKYDGGTEVTVNPNDGDFVG